MRCSVCGADNLEGAIYCEDCGARLPSAVPVAAPAAPVAPVAAAPAPAPTPVAPVEAAPAPPRADPDPAPVAQAPAGAPSSGNLDCPACGASNLPNVAFCEDCGASLSGGGAPVAPPPAHQEYGAAPATTSPPASATPAGRARLVLTTGKEFALDKDVILIGRRSPVDGIFPEVDLTDHDNESYISRRHGKLFLSETGILYEDLGSSNGSFLNGSKLQAGIQQVVQDGDNLRLGKTELVLRYN